MSYSACDFVEQVCNEAVELGLITKRQINRCNRREDTSLAARYLIEAMRERMKEVRVVTVIEGGILQNVMCSVPSKLVHIDYDTEGSGPEDGVVEMPQDGGGTAEAFVSLGGCDHDEKEVERVFQDAEKVTA